MSRKQKKQAKQGTYALCITAGLIVGLGLGPGFDNVLLSTLIGGALGAVAGYLLNQRQTKQKH